MATPTPSQPPNPSSASKRPNTAYNVSTPLVQGASPAQQQQQPRSHPSPTAIRTAGKTPINHPTASSTKTFGGTPMVQTLSQQGFGTASPSGVIGPNGTPSGMAGLGLGVDMMGTPGAMATTPNMGMGMGMGMGMNMVPSMSELGLSLTASGGQKRNDDEERRAKMRRILKKIGRPRGKVSEEGICRVGRRVGFANDIDAEVLTAEERERKVGNRTVSIAGEAVVVDVEMKNHVPQEVQVMLSGEGDVLVGMAEKAGQVLLESLKDTDNLERFAKGLEWIAKIDRLGGAKVNGFEALGGVFGSLRRLFDEETKLVEGSGAKSREKAEVTTMCKKSGKPVAHERGGLGISLDYWQENRGTSGKPSDTAMDVDSGIQSAIITTPPGLHTLHLDLERCPPEMYTPIRISSNWLPEKLEIESNTPIPWQDPEATFLSTADQDDSMANNNLPESQQKLLPSLRFLARLDPPIVLPWQTATNLLNSLGGVAPQAFQTPPLIHHIYIAPPLLGATDIEQQKTILARHGSEPESESTHVYRLHVPKPDFGLKLEELPFAHPRQLVENLPLLRQWGCFGALVQDLFSGTATASSLHVGMNGNRNGNSNTEISTKKDSISSLSGTAEKLSVTTSSGTEDNRISIDVSLGTAPAPSLSLAFPTLDGQGKISVRISVGLNGDVSVGGGVSRKVGEKSEAIEGKKAKRLASGLEVCGAVGVWIEWVRGEFSK